jgi:SAM-dependent methyltransferase
MPVSERIAQFREMYGDKKEYTRQFAIFERGCGWLDMDRVDAMRAKWLPVLARNSKIDYVKYFDTVYWLWHKSAYLAWLDLDRLPPQSVLDLGSGPGHFLFLCQAYGHTAIGVDLDYDVFRDLCDMQQVDYRVTRVEAATPLPDFGRSYDLVAAIWLKFDERYIEGTKPQRVRYWSGNDWATFLRLLAPKLNPAARVFLDLNNHHQPDGTLQHDKLFIQSLLDNGAKRVTGIHQRYLFENADTLNFIPHPEHRESFGVFAQD